MPLQFGVAIATPTPKDLVRYLICGEEAAGQVASYSKLPSGVRWWTNHSTQALFEAGWADSTALLPDSFLGTRMSTVASDLGLDPQSPEDQLATLARVLGSTIELATTLYGSDFTDRSLIAHLQSALQVAPKPSAEHRRLYDHLCHLALVGPDAPPKPGRGGRIVSLRRYRPRHMEDLFLTELPDEDAVTVEPVDQIQADDWTLLNTIPPAAGGLFAQGPYPQRDAWMLGEEFQLLDAAGAFTDQAAALPTRALRVHRTIDAPWVHTMLELALANSTPGPETPTFPAGPLQLRGPAALNYAIGLLSEAHWRALTQRPSALAIFVHARDRLATAQCAQRVAAALAAHDLGDQITLRRWRSGAVWLESTIPDPEDERALISALAAATEMVHPMWPAVVAESPRFHLGRQLLTPLIPRPDATLLGLHALGRRHPHLV